LSQRPLPVEINGYIVAQRDLTARGDVFQRSQILPVVRELERFAFRRETTPTRLTTKDPE